MSKLSQALENLFFSSYKRTIGIISVLILVLSIPLTLVLVKQQQELRQQAGGPETICETKQYVKICETKEVSVPDRTTLEKIKDCNTKIPCLDDYDCKNLKELSTRGNTAEATIVTEQENCKSVSSYYYCSTNNQCTLTSKKYESTQQCASVDGLPCYLTSNCDNKCVDTTKPSPSGIISSIVNTASQYIPGIQPPSAKSKKYFYVYGDKQCKITDFSYLPNGECEKNVDEFYNKKLIPADARCYDSKEVCESDHKTQIDVAKSSTSTIAPSQTSPQPQPGTAQQGQQFYFFDGNDTKCRSTTDPYLNSALCAQAILAQPNYSTDVIDPTCYPSQKACDDSHRFWIVQGNACVAKLYKSDARCRATNPAGCYGTEDSCKAAMPKTTPATTPTTTTTTTTGGLKCEGKNDVGNQCSQLDQTARCYDVNGKFECVAKSRIKQDCSRCTNITTGDKAGQFVKKFSCVDGDLSKPIVDPDKGLGEYIMDLNSGALREADYVKCDNGQTCPVGKLACESDTRAVAALADLEISEIKIDPAFPGHYDNFNITVTEKNLGPGQAASHRSQLFTNNQPGPVVGHAPLNTNQESKLLTGDGTCKFNAQFEIKATADILNTVAESNENNNTKTVTVACGVTPIAASDCNAQNVDKPCTSPVNTVCKLKDNSYQCVSTQQQIATGQSMISLSVKMPGIGNQSGDTRRENLKNPSRKVQVMVFNTKNSLIKDVKDKSLEFDGNNNFKGDVDLGTDLPAGDYLIKVRFANTLIKKLPELVTITPGTKTTAPELALVAGDVASGQPGTTASDFNGDNIMDLRDFEMLRKCHAKESTCTPQMSNMVDLNDNGSIDIVDFNIMLRGFAIRLGE